MFAVAAIPPDEQHEDSEDDAELMHLRISWCFYLNNTN